MNPSTSKRLLEHWQDEGEAALLYETLAGLEKDERRKKVFDKMAEVERRHQKEFADRLTAQQAPIPKFRPRLQARLLGWMAAHGSYSTVLNMTIRQEAKAVVKYQEDGAAEADGVPEHIAQEEVRHAQMLQGLSNSGREPWHHSDSGAFLRNAVYGFNDGLTANFGLLMGVLGAQMHSQQVGSSVVLMTGLAGLVADALSMGSSSYLADKSEQEVYEHEIAMEREEISSNPESEMEELALIYEAKGLSAAAARQVALQLMADPEIALREKAREELGISTDVGSPIKDGIVTGVATALGAFIPVFPFFFGSGMIAVSTAFAIAMLSHFGVGAARSLFTGRGVFRSGLDMFLVGLGVAVAAYMVGDVLMKHL